MTATMAHIHQKQVMRNNPLTTMSNVRFSILLRILLSGSWRIVSTGMSSIIFTTMCLCT